MLFLLNELQISPKFYSFDPQQSASIDVDELVPLIPPTSLL